MAALVTSWSYSRYADYKQCPLKFKLKVIDRMQEPGSPAMQRGNEIHKQAEDFLRAAGKPKIPAAYKTLTTQITHLKDSGAIVEQAWGYRSDWSWTGRADWFGNDVWFRAKADAVVTYDDDTALLIDWKTGKKYAANEEQVELFSLAAFKRFPHLKEVDTRLWYTDAPEADNEIQRTYTAADAGRIQKDWEKKIRPMFADRKFAPRPNDKCGWCAFSKAKGGPCKF